MPFCENFFLDIKKIHIAHRYTLNRTNRCAYPNGRGCYGIVFALKGEAEYHFLSSERLKIKAGNMLFLFPDNAYYISAASDFEHYTINFSIDESSSVLAELKLPYCITDTENFESAQLLFKNITDVLNQKRCGYAMKATGLVYELIYLFYNAYTKMQPSKGYRRLNPAKEYIEQHYNEAFTLSQLAFLTDMSLAHFRREWKKHHIESPMQYRDSIRVYYANEYLKSGYYTTKEVAVKCGFEDVSYFIRFLKRKTGKTPGQIKKEVFDR